MHPYATPLADLFALLLPEAALVAVACGLFLGGLFKADRRLWGSVALAGLALAFALHLWSVNHSARLDANATAAFGVPMLFDSLAHWSRVLALIAGIVFVLLAWEETPERLVADHHACFLLITAGVSLVGSANDLVTLFLALELVSIPTYVLLYLPKHDDASQEASIKYFLLSVFSSALLLFGFSYLFGLTGTTNIAGILQVLYGASPEEGRAVAGMAQIALLTIAAGLGFRVTAVPFHFYAPDVFQGTSTSGAAMLSYIPKVVGFIALLRVFGFVTPAVVNIPEHKQLGMALTEQTPMLILFLAALTMTLGNVLALMQDNLKRLLAYSSVAHAGYMLVALASAPYLSTEDAPLSGVAALLFYLAAYGTMTFGIFAVILLLHRPERPVETVDDLAGLAKSHPFLALLTTVLLLSLIGFPLTSGFTGKFFVFFGALSVQGPHAALYPALAVIGVLSAAIGAWYYLRIIAVMYLRGSVKPIETQGTWPVQSALLTCAVLTVMLSVPPITTWLFHAGQQTTARSAPALQQAQR
jgi:NADH-quinone oxidoreductase subunit N